MKRIKELIFVLIMFVILPKDVYASEKYSIGDFVYYDPILTRRCDYTNYWTPYNQNSTCYRFVVLSTDNIGSETKLKIMLDHDVGYGTYDNYKVILDSGTKNWTRYNGEVDIIDEETIYKVMKLSQKPTLDSISVNGGVALGFLKTNSLYTINKKQYSNYGYWSKNHYEKDNNYIYTVTEYANNRLVEKNNKRGVRPVIVVDKKDVIKHPEMRNIDSIIASAVEYKYKHINKRFGNYYYKQLQGFTLAKDKLVFHASNNSTPNMGLLSTYNGKSYQTSYKNDYSTTAHGNDMTYNSNTNKVLLLVDKEIYEYNGDTITYEKRYTTSDKGDLLYTALGYDGKHDHYYALSGTVLYVLTNKFEKIYSFDITALGIYQGLEYHNGYIYMTTAEYTCPNKYQLYCNQKKYSSIVYVYNAKFNNDGTPTKDFGKLVEKLYVDKAIGELESVSFNTDQIILGYATQSVDSTYSFKFYSFPYGKIMYQPDYTINYNEAVDKKIITISSNEELKSIDGWTISSDLKTLTKEVVGNTASTSINICDLYNNCKMETIKEFVFEEKPILEGEDSNIIDTELEETKDETTEETEISEKQDVEQNIYIIILILILTLIVLVYIIYKWRKKNSKISI